VTFSPMRLAAIACAVTVIASCTDTPTEPDPAPIPSTVDAASAAAVNQWISRAAYPVNNWNATSAAVATGPTRRTVLYVIGGSFKETGGAGSISDAVRAYDVNANVWRNKAPFPVRVMGTNGAVEINGKIYVSGGFTRRYDAERDVYFLQTLRSLYVYDPATDRWTRLRDMPITSARGVSGAYQGMLYVASGALWRYNPGNNNWVQLSRTPHDPGYGGGGFIGGKFYLVSALVDVDIYDVATNTWSTGPRRPLRYCTPASATMQAKLYLVGCHDDNDFSGNWPMLVFDPQAGSWSGAAAPPIAATGYSWTLSRVFVENRPRLELVGGARPNNNWQYVP
jgi:hypothetical protein